MIGGGFVCLWRDCPRKEREFNARYKMLIHMRIHTRSAHYPIDYSNTIYVQREAACM